MGLNEICCLQEGSTVVMTAINANNVKVESWAGWGMTFRVRGFAHMYELCMYILYIIYVYILYIGIVLF